MKGMDVIMKDVPMPDPKDNKKIIHKSMPFVRPITDDKAEPKLLTAYADDQLKSYLPALRKVADAGTSRADGREISFPEQRAAKPATSTGETSDAKAAVASAIKSTFASPFEEKKG
jgi:hypothetical protein